MIQSNGGNDTINRASLSLKNQMTASIVGGMVTAIAVTPLDVLKTRLQTSTKNKNSLETLLKIIRTEGLPTLWRGLGPTLLMNIPSSAIYFTSYEWLKKALYNSTIDASRKDNDMRFMVPLVGGSLARVLSATVISPIELMRTNSQGVHLSGGQSFSTVRLYKEIVNNVGIKGLWRGLGPSLLRDVPFSAFYWGGYELAKDRLMKLTTHDYDYRVTPTPFYINFLSGAISGSFAAIVTTPIDVIKTRIQMTVQQKDQELLSSSSRNNPNTKFLTTTSPTQQFKLIIQHEGWIGLTKGLGPRVAKITPACAIMVSTYEWLKSINF